MSHVTDVSHTTTQEPSPLAVSKHSPRTTQSRGGARRRASSISPSRSERRAGRPRGPRCRGASTRAGRLRRCGGTRSSCSRSRPRRACRSWSRSGTDGCSSRRSRSTAAPPTSWPPTWRARRGRVCTPSSAATRTCPTSAPTPLPTGGSCSTSTTSTRRCRARSSGTSSAWSRASRSPVATVGSTTSSAGRSTWRPRRAYREAIREYAAMRNLDIWYSRIDVDALFASLQERVTAKQAKRAEANLAKAQSKDSLRAFAKLTEVVDGEPRFVSEPPVVVPVRELLPTETDYEQLEEQIRGMLQGVPADARRRPPPAARAVPVRRHRTQDRGGRQRRHARLDPPDGRTGQRGSADPAGQGGGGVGARAVPRQERVREPRPAGGRGPAADAGGQRHHARLDPLRRARRRQARLLPPPALGREGLGPRRAHGAEPARRLRRDLRQGARPRARQVR